MGILSEDCKRHFSAAWPYVFQEISGISSRGWESGEVWKLDTARMAGPNGCLGPSSEDSNMIFQISSVLDQIQCTSLGLGFAADYFMNLAADYFTNLLTRKQIQSVTPSSQQYLFVWLVGWLVGCCCCCGDEFGAPKLLVEHNLEGLQGSP